MIASIVLICFTPPTNDSPQLNISNLFILYRSVRTTNPYGSNSTSWQCSGTWNTNGTVIGSSQRCRSAAAGRSWREICECMNEWSVVNSASAPCHIHLEIWWFWDGLGCDEAAGPPDDKLKMLCYYDQLIQLLWIRYKCFHFLFQLLPYLSNTVSKQ